MEVNENDGSLRANNKYILFRHRIAAALVFLCSFFFAEDKHFIQPIKTNHKRGWHNHTHSKILKCFGGR